MHTTEAGGRLTNSRVSPSLLKGAGPVGGSRGGAGVHIRGWAGDGRGDVSLRRSTFNRRYYLTMNGAAFNLPPIHAIFHTSNLLIFEIFTGLLFVIELINEIIFGQKMT